MSDQTTDLPATGAAFTPRLIVHTDQMTRCPWPDGVYIQGGDCGLVFSSAGRYETAFVEAFPGTFLRGEGATIADAETACWQRYQAMMSCPTAPAHGPFEARHYRNGAGYCTKCDTWFPKVLPVDPGKRRVDPFRELVNAAPVTEADGRVLGTLNRRASVPPRHAEEKIV